MKIWSLSTRVLLLALIPLCLQGAPPARGSLGGVPVFDDLPATPAEYREQTRGIPDLILFGVDADNFTSGTQIHLFNERPPLGPAPHTPWAKPLANGPLQVTLLAPLPSPYDVAEIQRRLGCAARWFWVPPWAYIPQRYPEAYSGYFTKQALQMLAKDADVLFIGPNVRLLAPAVGEAILKKVEGGCGLVLCGGAIYGGGGGGYWPLIDKIEVWKKLFARFARAETVDTMLDLHNVITQHHVISKDGLFDGIPFELLPSWHLGKMQPAEGAEVLATDNGVPLAIGTRIGKGYAVLLTYLTDGGLPVRVDHSAARVKEYQDYFAAVVIRALQRAAGRPSPLRLALDKTTAAAGAPVPVTLTVTGAGAKNVQVELRLRDLECRPIWQEKKPLAGETLAVTLPALAGGDYLFDIIARDHQGASCGWASFAYKVSATGTLQVALDRESYRSGTPVTVTAAVTGASAGELTATLRVTDALDRLLVEETKPLVGNKATWTFANQDPLCVLHYADVAIQKDGAPYLAGRAEIFVPRYTFPDFRNCLWGGYVPDYAQERVDRRLREQIGFDVMLCGGYGGEHKSLNYQHLRSGAIPFFTNVAYQQPTETERDPVQARAADLKLVEGSLDQLRTVGGAVIFFQDERGAFGDCGKPTAAALPLFRAYLKTRYRDIAALNKAWGRHYQDFAEVLPVLTVEFDPATEASLAPWLDWRLWVIHEIVGIDRAAAARIRESLGHDCWMGLEGIFGTEEHNIPFGGFDFWAQSVSCCNAAAPYSEVYLNLCQSFYPGPSFAWNGYSAPYSTYLRYVWARALQGDWSLGWFMGNTFYSGLDGFMPQARWVRDLTKPLREGVGKLLLANQPIRREPIAFLYSQPSLYAMSILGKTIATNNPHLFVRTADWARDSLQRMLFDCGVQFSYVSEQQTQQGALADKGIKVLILSSCVALEPATCRRIEQFVAAGGLVVADLCPGVWDEHGAYQTPGQLDHLFGVKHNGRFAFEQMAMDYGIGITESVPGLETLKDTWLIGQWFEKTLEVADGRALGHHFFGSSQQPAFVFKKTGQGATLLMNYLEIDYRRVPEHWQNTVMQAVLHYASIRAPFTLRDAEQAGEPIHSGLIATRRTDGAATYLGLLLDQGKKVRLELAQGGQIYELSRGGHYLGAGPIAELDLRDQPYALFAILPYKVESVSLQAGTGRRGQPLPLEFQIKTSAPPVRHVVHLDVYRPDGSYAYALSRNFVFANGHWTGALPLALNDPPGKWRVVAREVVSGLTAARRVAVR